jgi:hypothetical protein
MQRRVIGFAANERGLLQYGPGTNLGCRKLAYLSLLSQFTAARELKQIVHSKWARIAASLLLRAF